MTDPHPAEAWRPSAPQENLRARAQLLRALRDFFARRGVLEVETPLLGSGGSTDLHLGSLETQTGDGRSWYLQTSPEFAMKRLLAAGSGSIYQIGRAFRNDESGRLHNPEFTLLEWYRVGWDHQALMNEIDDLLSDILGEPAAERLTYAELFDRHLALNPHRATKADLGLALARAEIEVANPESLDCDTLLQVLMSQVIEPALPSDRPTFVYDFPPSQAALARIRPGPPSVAERFEVYVRGVELANGYHELRDPDEQAHRFRCDLEARGAHGLPRVEPDQHLLAALRAGLPACAGVALGVDRLLLLRVGADHLDQVLAFPTARA